VLFDTTARAAGSSANDRATATALGIDGITCPSCASAIVRGRSAASPPPRSTPSAPSRQVPIDARGAR